MRRNFILFLGLLIVSNVFLAACGVTTTPTAQKQPPTEEIKGQTSSGDFNWRKFEGEKIRVAMVTQPWSEFLNSGDYLQQFRDLTGIEVTYEILPEDQFRQKTTIEFAAGTSDVDIFLSQAAQEGIKYESAGWYANIEELLNNKEITDPNFDFTDFSKSSLSIARLSNGKLIGLPVYNEFGALFYNKELLEKAGITSPPTTIEEMEAAAKAIHNPDNGIYGVCLRGKGAASTSQFSSVMHGFGADWINAEGKSNILDPNFVKAIEWYGMMDREYGPPGATSYHWQQCQDIFLQGKAGLWQDASVFFANLVDPEQSKIVDKVGITIAPAGPAGQIPYVGGWHLSIYNNSQHKEAAWLFMQWALGKEMTLQAQLHNITTGRQSAWQSPKYTSQNKYPELAEQFLKAMTMADSRWNPPVLAVSEARDAIGAAIVTAIEGGDVQTALKNADQVMQKLLADTPKLQ